jgi:predicted DNA-binding antitoxin AbrB/MazE fold protein
MDVAPITAIFENGVFRPTQKVDLPEGTTVRFEPTLVPSAVRTMVPPGTSEGQIRIYETLLDGFHSGRHDLAERHNEHQP